MRTLGLGLRCGARGKLISCRPAPMATYFLVLIPFDDFYSAKMNKYMSRITDSGARKSIPSRLVLSSASSRQREQKKAIRSLAKTIIEIETHLSQDHHRRNEVIISVELNR